MSNPLFHPGSNPLAQYEQARAAQEAAAAEVERHAEASDEPQTTDAAESAGSETGSVKTETIVTASVGEAMAPGSGDTETEAAADDTTTGEAGDDTPPGGIDLATAFADARVVMLPDYEGDRDARGLPRSVAAHRLVEVTEPLTVIDGEGTSLTVDPEGRSGTRARYLLRTPRGSIEPLDADELERRAREGDSIVSTHGEQANGYRIGFFAATMTALMQARAERARREQQREAAAMLRESEDYSYSQWVTDQLYADARAARQAYQAAEHTYDEVTGDQRVQSELRELMTLREKKARGANTIQDDFAMQRALRNIDRVLQTDTDLAERFDAMREHTDRMTECMESVFSTLREHPHLAGEFENLRHEMPGETAVNRLTGRLRELTRNGEREEEQRRMERLRELAREVTEAVVALLRGRKTAAPGVEQGA